MKDFLLAVVVLIVVCGTLWFLKHDDDQRAAERRRTAILCSIGRGVAVRTYYPEGDGDVVCISRLVLSAPVEPKE